MLSTVRSSGPTARQFRAYGIAANEACANLAIYGEEARREYRRMVVREETGLESFRDIRLNSDIDAVMSRLWSDAGDWEKASSYGINDSRQIAFLIKVSCLQLMQLKGGSEEDARRYLDGLLVQAKVPNGTYTADNSYWLDVSKSRLLDLFKILDTERRKVFRRHFPKFAVKLDTTARYVINGPISIRCEVSPDYYANAPFSVLIREES